MANILYRMISYLRLSVKRVALERSVSVPVINEGESKRQRTAIAKHFPTAGATRSWLRAPSLRWSVQDHSCLRGLLLQHSTVPGQRWWLGEVR